MNSSDKIVERALYNASQPISHPIPDGAKVRLCQWNNGTEVVPAQDGTILSCDDMQDAWKIEGQGGFSYLVEVAPEEEGDDGLRELTGDQIEAVIALPDQTIQ